MGLGEGQERKAADAPTAEKMDFVRFSGNITGRSAPSFDDNHEENPKSVKSHELKDFLSSVRTENKITYDLYCHRRTGP